MDRTGQFFEGPLAAPIVPLIGGNVEAYDGLPEGSMGKVEMNDIQYDWGVWGDLLYAEESTKVLATYADQFYQGAAAILQRKHGKGGSVTYCGVFPEEPLADALLETLCGQLGIATHPLPRKVYLLQRGAYHICLNFQDAPYELPAIKGARFILGSRVVDPADVAIWEQP
jgi:beta-galactosidase